MSIMMGKFLATILVVAAVASLVNGLDSRKLDESSVAGTPNDEIKCSSCSPCNNPCTQSPPPPPPPPALPPPPPPPKKPPTQYCPPPPSSFIYMTGPPGNLYPVDPYFSGAGRLDTGLPTIMVCSGILLGFLAFW